MTPVLPGLGGARLGIMSSSRVRMPTTISLFTLFTFDKTPEKCVKGKEVAEIAAH